jgi:hypothetical protein
MKTILLDIINSDTSYNKSATRYLYKTHPELWKNIIKATGFLPESALAKQRVWHILNECYVRPVCPISNEYLPWREKQYAKYATLTAKNQGITEVLSKVTSGKNHWRNKDPNKAKQANKKYSKGLETGRIKIDRSKRDSRAILEKAKQTFIEKYGVDNPSKLLEVQKKISDKRIENGATPKHLRSLRRLYYDAVWKVTEQSWKDHFDKINPQRLNRSKNALDHVYSIQQGFRDNIPPYIIGHWTNLTVISLSENSIKGMACSKTQEKLFEDFFDNQ